MAAEPSVIQQGVIRVPAAAGVDGVDGGEAGRGLGKSLESWDAESGPEPRPWSEM